MVKWCYHGKWIVERTDIPLMRTKTATDIPTMYFHLSPECPPASSLVISGWATAWWGLEGADEGKGSFFSFGTEGNEPLLLVLGRAIIMGSVVETLLAGAATRLLDYSASLRRTMSSRFFICDSEEFGGLLQKTPESSVKGPSSNLSEGKIWR